MEKFLTGLKSINAKELYMYLLGAFIVGCSISVIHVLIKNPVPLANHDVIMLAVGALLTKSNDVISYFYGSSKGSADKTQILKTSVPKQEEPGA